MAPIPRKSSALNDSFRTEDWLGRSARSEDCITSAPIKGLVALLDRDDPAPADGDALPPLWHWLYFLPADRESSLGDDGHAKRGGFLPPVPLPRRMWAGGRLVFLQPLRVGQAVTRTSWVADISQKAGRSGPLVFVRVEHEIANSGGVALRETHDIVYRDAPRDRVAARARETAPSPVTEWAESQFSRTVVPDPVLLFRYSALTFNGHRIHYDRSYVREVEGYPGLVVHGPLLATLLVDLLRRERPGQALAEFSFKALQPLFDTAPFTLCGRVDESGDSAALWALDAGGSLAMQATARFAR